MLLALQAHLLYVLANGIREGVVMNVGLYVDAECTTAFSDAPNENARVYQLVAHRIYQGRFKTCWNVIYPAVPDDNGAGGTFIGYAVYDYETAIQWPNSRSGCYDGNPQSVDDLTSSGLGHMFRVVDRSTVGTCARVAANEVVPVPLQQFNLFGSKTARTEFYVKIQSFGNYIGNGGRRLQESADNYDPPYVQNVDVDESPPPSPPPSPVEECNDLGTSGLVVIITGSILAALGLCMLVYVCYMYTYTPVAKLSLIHI